MTDKSITQNSFDLSSTHDPSALTSFEQHVIEAYKATSIEESYRSLLSALGDISVHIELIKSQSVPITKPLITKQIAERLRRIASRHYFHLTIQIAKIYIALLNKANLPFLSINMSLLIQIANDVIVLLDLIKFTSLHKRLLIVNQDYLSYLLSNDSGCSDLATEQKEAIDALRLNFPSRYISEAYHHFPDRVKEIIIEDRTIKTFTAFTSTLSGMISIEEQYDSLKSNESLYFITNYLKTDNKNKEDCYLLFSIGKMLTLFLFSTKYVIKATHDNDNHQETDDSCKTYLLIDAQKQNVSKIQKSSYNNISFSCLNDVIYEVSEELKEVMISNKSFIIYLSKLFIGKVLHSCHKKFDLLYVCFVLMKRVWFTFNEAFNEMSSIFLEIIDNMFKITNEKQKFSAEIDEIAELLNYLLFTTQNEGFLNQIKERLPLQISSNKSNRLTISEEVIHIKDCNILTGYPLHLTIEAGSKHTQYFDISKENSLLYIYFSVNTKDISFSLLKYSPNASGDVSVMEEDETDKGHFSRVFQLEYAKCSVAPIKLILFAQLPGVYKMIFNNSYSWITSKEVKYRVNVLKPLTNNVSFDKEICLEKQTSSVEPHRGKFNVYYNSIDYSLDVSAIESKMKLLEENRGMLVIPIIFYANRIIFQLENQLTSFIDSNNHLFFSKEFLYETIEGFLNTKGLKNKRGVESITLSFLSLNGDSLSNDEEEDDTNKKANDKVNEEGLIKDSMEDYMKAFKEKYSTKLKYYFNVLTEIALISSLYTKEKDHQPYETIIYFYIESNTAQVSIFNDGLIYDEIKGFEYNPNQTLIENIGVFKDVIQKTNESFEEITVEISSSNVPMSVIDDLNAKLIKDTKKIVNSIAYIPLNLTTLHLLL